MRAPESIIENGMGFKVVSDKEGSFAPVREEVVFSMFFYSDISTLTKDEILKIIFDDFDQAYKVSSHIFTS